MLMEGREEGKVGEIEREKREEGRERGTEGGREDGYFSAER